MTRRALLPPLAAGLASFATWVAVFFALALVVDPSWPRAAIAGSASGVAGMTAGCLVKKWVAP